MSLMNEPSPAAVEAALAYLLERYRRTHGDPQEAERGDEDPADQEAVA